VTRRAFPLDGYLRRPPGERGMRGTRAIPRRASDSWRCSTRRVLPAPPMSRGFRSATHSKSETIFYCEFTVKSSQ